MGTSKVEEFTIPARFCGPPRSGNGGYSCGMFASAVDAPVVQVTLRAPPPLDTPLTVTRAEGQVAFQDGEKLIATARPGELTLEVMPAPDMAAAREAMERYAGHRKHIFPGCFVCGPARDVGDGLRIFPGSLGKGVVASVVDWAAAGVTGAVARPAIWAALDCPGYFAVASDDDAAVLGQLTARIYREPAADEMCTVQGWALDRDKRKRRCGTAIYDEGGEVIAAAFATWIEVEHLREEFA